MRPSPPPATQEHGSFYKAQFGTPRRRSMPPRLSPRLAPVLSAVQRVELEVRLEKELAIAMPTVAVPDHGPPSVRFSPMAPKAPEMPPQRSTELGVVAAYLLPQISRGDATPALVDVTFAEVTRLLSSREPELALLLDALHAAVRRQRATPVADRDSTIYDNVHLHRDSTITRSARDVSYRYRPTRARCSVIPTASAQRQLRDWKEPLGGPVRRTRTTVAGGPGSRQLEEEEDAADDDGATVADLETRVLMEADTQAAITLQRMQRGSAARRSIGVGSRRAQQVGRARRRKLLYESATTIGRHARGRLVRTARWRQIPARLSALRLQRAWRARCSRLAENFYRRCGVHDPSTIERLNRLRAELVILHGSEVCCCHPAATAPSAVTATATAATAAACIFACACASPMRASRISCLMCATPPCQPHTLARLGRHRCARCCP